jgi:hypothetical protein
LPIRGTAEGSLGIPLGPPGIGHPAFSKRLRPGMSFCALASRKVQVSKGDGGWKAKLLTKSKRRLRFFWGYRRCLPDAVGTYELGLITYQSMRFSGALICGLDFFYQ